MKLWNPECTLGECFPSRLRNRKGARDYVQNFLAAFNQANLNQGEPTCLEDVLPPCHSPTLSQSGWNYYHASRQPLDDWVDAVGIICGGPHLRHGNPLSSRRGEY